ncbi:MAG: hypothetical protein AAGF11_51515 [Myxococcota bacterium]
MRMVHGLAVSMLVAGCSGPTIDLVEGENDSDVPMEDVGVVDAFPEWPPALPPGQPADVGDGTLADPMLLIGETEQGPLYLWLYAERRGDELLGEVAEVEYVDGQWTQAAASRPLESTLVDRNCFLSGAQGVGVSVHPYGGGPLILDLTLHSVLYDDRLLCGDAWIDGWPGRNVQMRYVAKPLAEVGGDPQPALRCD